MDKYKTNSSMHGPGMDLKRLPGPLLFGILSLVMGIIAGTGAVIFRGIIAFFHNLLFLGKFSLLYDANFHTPEGPWGALVILVPVLGALGVAFLVRNFAPEARGAGVPEVMDAIYYNRGIIRPVVALVKSLASALSIGSGGAVGREGPIIQISSSLGSTIGQWLRIPSWQRITLIAAGAAGGIAATFNTPIGGVLFAVEILMHEVSVRTLVPVTLAASTATYTGRFFLGNHPSFIIPRLESPYFHLASPMVLPSYVVLGLLLGVLSAVFIRSVYLFEDFFEKRLRGNYYLRHAAAMLVTGLIMYIMMVRFGHYYIQGVGYATIQDILSSRLTQVLMLLFLFGLKLFATSITLGSGASGGIFSPALFLGATLGGAYGFVVHSLFPLMTVHPLAFAVAGMAGMVAGTTGAALAAIIMTFEMTLDYNVIVPITITVALSHGVRRALSRPSIYALKLERRNHHMPEALRVDFHHLLSARDIMDTGFAVLTSGDTLDELARVASGQPEVSWFLITDGEKVKGFVTKEAAVTPLCQIREAVTLGSIADTRFINVAGNTALFDVMDSMRLADVAVALIVDDPDSMDKENVKGLITKHQIGDTMAKSVELYSDKG